MSLYIDFKVIKASVNITQVLEYYGLADQFTKSSDAWRGPCPIHKGTNPTQFSVSISKNCWKCFSGDCHAHGNVLNFVAHMENCKISQAARKLADWFQIQAEYIPNHLRGNPISKQTGNSKLAFERYVISPDGKMHVEMPTGHRKSTTLSRKKNMSLPIPEKVPELGFYYHYKHDPEGAVNNYAYEVIGIGFHTEEDVRPGEAHFVIYRPLYEALVYKVSRELRIPCFDSRPLEMWMGDVEKGEVKFPRFKKITNPATITELTTIQSKMYP